MKRASPVLVGAIALSAMACTRVGPAPRAEAPVPATGASAPTSAAARPSPTDVDDHMDVLDAVYDRFFRRAQSAPFEPADWPHLMEGAPRAAETARDLANHARGPGWDVLSLAVAESSTALAAAVAAESRDEEAIREHLETIGAACSGCHDEYR